MYRIVTKLNNKFRFFHIYYLLAAFDVLMLVGSLTLNHLNMLTFSDAIKSAEVFTNVSAELEKLSNYAALTNVPGNDIFDSRDVIKERKIFDESVTNYKTMFEKLKNKAILNNLPPYHLSSLNKIDQAYESMTHETKNIFKAFERNDIKYAGTRMATMDRKFALLNLEVASYRGLLIKNQEIELKQEAKQLSSLSLYEKILGLSILIIVLAVSFLGHAIGKKIEEKEKLLIQSSKLSSLGEMAGGIAHEINNPLAIIQLNASQLRRLIIAEKFEKTKSISMLEKIESTTSRIGKIIDGLRNFSRNEVGEKQEKVLFSKLMSDVEGLCHERLKRKNIRFEVIQKVEIEIACRVIQLEQVLVNLINNSYDAIQASTDPWIRMQAFMDDKEFLNIVITDSGNGIPATIAKKIMQPFFSTKPIGEGTGLGLSISFAIIASHEGSLTYNPESPNTQFLIKLPGAKVVPRQSAIKPAA